MSEPLDMPEIAIGEADERAVNALLRGLQRVVLTHPEATRALFLALEQEGRLFAQTATGARFRERIERSKLLERALLVWQSATLWADEEPGTGVPSAFVTALAAAAASPARDAMLASLFPTDAERDP